MVKNRVVQNKIVLCDLGYNRSLKYYIIKSEEDKINCVTYLDIFFRWSSLLATYEYMDGKN